MRVCVDCSADISDRGSTAKRCLTCAKRQQQTKHAEYERKRRANMTQEQREVARKYQHDYYLRPEVQVRKRAYRKTYRAIPENKERRNRNQRDRLKDPVVHAKHRAYHRAYHARWRKGNSFRQEAHRVTQADRRARRRNQVGKLSKNILTALIAEQRGKCYYCRRRFTKKRRATLEHLIPLVRGGIHGDSNIRAACLSCNSAKGGKTDVEWAQANGRLFY